MWICYFLQNGPKISPIFPFKAIFSLSAKFRKVGTLSMWKYTSLRTPIHWWQLRHPAASVQTIHLLLLNNLLYTNLGTGSNPGLLNEISWPKQTFKLCQIAQRALICPILQFIKVLAESKISFGGPYLHCATLSKISSYFYLITYYTPIWEVVQTLVFPIKFHGLHNFFQTFNWP